jgi:alpha-1,6-mannosyltransferase
VTDWAGREFERLGAPNLARVPLGVDLTTFHPTHASRSLRRALGAQDDVLIVVTDRLAPEQQPELAIETVRTLDRRGIAARLIVAGEGVPDLYQRRVANLPVTFLGHVCDGPDLAQLLATADIALAWGPLQSAGLAALEALASGTPVVARRDGALVELHGGGGATADGHAVAFADAVTQVMSTDMARRRALARLHAERFARPAMVDRMLAVHQASARPAVAAYRVGGQPTSASTAVSGVGASRRVRHVLCAVSSSTYAVRRRMPGAFGDTGMTPSNALPK